MSPSESELRAALRACEGPGVDVDGLLAHARGVRHTRRMRIASAAGAAAVVAGIGTGIAFLPGTSPSSSTSHSASNADRGAAGSAASTPGATSGPAGSAAGGLTACPHTPLRLMVPGGGGTSQFGATGPLIARTVDRLRICGYATTSLGGTIGYGGSLTLTGADAQQFAGSLNSAVTTPPRLPCPTIQPALRELVVYPATASGGVLSPVVVDVNACPVVATNGTAVRYAWTPPQRWAGPLDGLMLPRGHATIVRPTTHPTGSPLR